MLIYLHLLHLLGNLPVPHTFSLWSKWWSWIQKVNSPEVWIKWIPHKGCSYILFLFKNTRFQKQSILFLGLKMGVFQVKNSEIGLWFNTSLIWFMNHLSVCLNWVSYRYTLSHNARLLHSTRSSKLLHVLTEVTLSTFRPHTCLALPASCAPAASSRGGSIGWQLDRCSSGWRSGCCRSCSCWCSHFRLGSVR